MYHLLYSNKFDFLHPFIPFVTEEIWLKNKFDNDGSDYFMLKNWSEASSNKEIKH